jgi:hypothetical protein
MVPGHGRLLAGLALTSLTACAVIERAPTDLASLRRDADVARAAQRATIEPAAPVRIAPPAHGSARIRGACRPSSDQDATPSSRRSHL